MSEEHSGAEDLRSLYELIDSGRHEEAFAECRRLVFYGSASAQHLLGWMYHYGKGVQRDLALAEQLYLKVIKAPSTKLSLATLYHQQGNIQNTLELLRQSAEQGYTPSMYYLARMYLSGEGVEVNRPLALEYMHKAASRGHVWAMRQLAQESLTGRLGIRRIPAGIAMLAKALWKGTTLMWADPNSQFLRNAALPRS